MNILTSTLTLVIASATWISPTHAQAPGSASVGADSTAAAGVKKDPRDEAASLLRAKGNAWTPGYHKDTDRLIAIGSATIAVKSSDGAFDFGEARAIAFEEAMMDAKKQLANMLAMSVSTSVTSSRASKRGTNKPPKAAPSNAGPVSMGEKISALANSYMDEALNSQGITPGQATEEQIKEVTRRKDFQAGLKTAAAAELYGAYAWRTFEEINPGKKGRIAVIVMCTAKSKQMALAMLGEGEAPTGKAKTSNFEHVSELHDNGTLLYTFGVRQRTNENGELCLLAFGQAAAEGDGDWDIEDAEGYADDAAISALRMFAGEALVTSRDAKRGATLKGFADKSEEYTNTSMRKESIKSVADTMPMPGAMPLTYKTEIHPLVGDSNPIVVRVYEWNLSSARDLADLAKQMNSVGGSAGGKGVTGSPNSTTSTESDSGVESNPGRPGEGNSGSSDNPDDDDT